MHIHILGICGTFMGSLAVLAKQMGFRVSGSDANCYPPMSTQLEGQGIEIIEGYDPEQLVDSIDLVIIGNAMSRGNPCVEAVLNRQLAYTSGPQWLRDYVLTAKDKPRHVIALSGTHGKTTTSSMVTHILHQCGIDAGYLIGGVPQDFETSSYLGSAKEFVIEADEYDSAFFDKRSKFVHYVPRTLVINNLEFDHADIFDDLAAIQKQFHHVVRTVASEGAVIYPAGVAAIDAVIKKGCWSEQQSIAFRDNTLNSDRSQQKVNSDWQAVDIAEDGSVFSVNYRGKHSGTVQWSLTGQHNVANGMSAIAAAVHAGVVSEKAVEALSQFGGVKRRLELLGEVNGVRVYDDFAHHPTAIQTTLEGMRAKLGDNIKITAVIEPRSNTMKMGVHKNALQASAQLADKVYWYQSPENSISWQFNEAIMQDEQHRIVQGLDNLIEEVSQQSIAGEHIVIMSNGGFGGFHQKLMVKLGESSERP